MAGEWSNFTLGDLCSLITDGKHGDCEDQANSGFYFLSVKDVVGNRLVYGNEIFLKLTDGPTLSLVMFSSPIREQLVEWRSRRTALELIVQLSKRVSRF
jgi:hypothetical protein